MPFARSNTIDLDRLASIAAVGVRRAAVFLGLGVNAARDNNLNTYQLGDFTLIQLVTYEVPPYKVAEFKRHFEDWIINNALREVVESFERFLDGIDAVCRRVELAQDSGGERRTNLLKQRAKFEHAGIDEKLRVLRRNWKIATSNEAYFHSIKQARNCVTHRGGVVGKRDIGTDQTLRLKWWRIRLFLKGESGKETDIDPPFPPGGFVTDEAASVCVQMKDRIREFKSGSRIEFTLQDVVEICQLTKMTSDELLVSLVHWLQHRGVKVNAKQSPQQE